MSDSEVCWRSMREVGGAMAQYYTATSLSQHNNNIINMKDTDGGYSLLGYPGGGGGGGGYDVGEQCEPGDHYLHSVRIQHAAARQTQDHRRPGK